MRDLYDENTKRVTAFVKLGGKPNPVWLRRWYWFDNAIWRINAIKDWNIGSYDSTEVEFIKVQDVNNYDLAMIGTCGRQWLILDSNYIGQSGGTLTATVYSNNPSAGWDIGIDSGEMSWSDEGGNSGYIEGGISPYSGTGESTPITITVPANNGARRTYLFKLYPCGSDIDAVEYRFTQEGNTAPALSISPSTATVGSGIDGYSFTFTSANIQSGTYAVASSMSFCTVMVNENNHTITATVSANSGASRSTTITLTATGIDSTTARATATLTQEGNSLSVSPNELTFDYDSTTGQNLTITSNGDWTVNITDEE